MDQTRQLERYIFRRPLWRKAVPVFLLTVIWLLPLFIWKGHLLPVDETPFEGWPQKGHDWLNRFGIDMRRALVGTGAISALLVLWLFTGMQTLIITPEAVIRRLPLGIRRTLRWIDIDEVLIDLVEARFEGDVTARKTLYLYSIPRGLFKTRRKLTIKSRHFEGYDDVERIAVQVSVPAVAARLRERINHTRKPALFPVREPGEGLFAFLLFCGGIFVLFAAAYDPFWSYKLVQQVLSPDYQRFVRPPLAAIAVIVMFTSFLRFFYKQIGVDAENIYVLVRKYVRRRIPIDTVADIQIHDNQMRIYAFTKDPEIPRQVFKTNRFIRNRGVLLRLIREEYEARRATDDAPIATTRPSMGNDRPAES
ncbi:MAG: hypothetical protein ACR2IE_08670 [Candidatus Sumerlaeaceae bacterium]